MEDRHIPLTVAENDRVFEIGGTANEAAQGFPLGGTAFRCHQALRYGDGRRSRASHFDAHRIVQESLGKSGDLRRHGGGEKQGLAGERHKLADALDIRNEPHVEHPVGFIDDENFDCGQEQLAAFGKIQKAAGRRDQDVGAPHDLGFLVAEGNAANEQCNVELMVNPVAGETFLDLRGKFAGRLQDQGARHPRSGAAFLQT